MLTTTHKERVEEILSEFSDEYADELEHYIRLAAEPDPRLNDAERFEKLNRTGSKLWGVGWLRAQGEVIAVARSFGLDPAKHRSFLAAMALRLALAAKAPTGRSIGPFDTEQILADEENL